MRVLIIKMAWSMAVWVLNGIGGKYLTDKNGHNARKWVERKVILKLEAWSVNTDMTADDSLVEFMQAFLKSGQIDRVARYHKAEPMVKEMDGE